MSKWTEPFGFTKAEVSIDRDDDPLTADGEGTLELLVLLSLIALDILTLPLALLRRVEN